MHARTYPPVHTCTHAIIHALARTRAHTHTHTRAHGSTHAHTPAHMHVHTAKHTRTHSAPAPPPPPHHTHQKRKIQYLLCRMSTYESRAFLHLFVSAHAELCVKRSSDFVVIVRKARARPFFYGLDTTGVYFGPNVFTRLAWHARCFICFVCTFSPFGFLVFPYHTFEHELKTSEYL